MRVVAPVMSTTALKNNNSEYIPPINSCSNSNNNPSTNESSLMDTAAGFFKSLTGERTAERAVTPPRKPPCRDESPPESPISSFRRDPEYNLPDDFPDDEVDQEDENDVGEASILMIRSFGSVEESVEPNHIQQARQAISSVATQSRLSDERIHQILLAAMHYQSDHSHTLPSHHGGLGGPLGTREEEDEEEHPSLRLQYSASPLNFLTGESHDDEDDESSIENASTVSNAGGILSDEESSQQWHESSNRSLLAEISSTGGTTTSTMTHQHLSPKTNYLATDAVHGNAPYVSKKADISPKPPTLVVDMNNPPATPPPPPPLPPQPALHTATPATLRHLDSPLAAPPSAMAEGVFRPPEEKKEDPQTSPRSPTPTFGLMNSFSITESDVGSLDGLPLQLQTDWREGRERVLEQLDGVNALTAPPPLPHDLSSPKSGAIANYSNLGDCCGPTDVNDDEDAFNDQIEERQEKSTSIFDSLGISCLWVSESADKEDDHERQKPHRISWKEEAEETLALFGCAPLINHHEDMPPAVANSLVRVTDAPALPSFAESVRDSDNEVDFRLHKWIEGLYRRPDPVPYDGSYALGKSRTVIVHEIHRGDWTWCTVWSPKGDRLAVATENHHLAVIETMSSAVWRVRHDRRLTGPAKNHTTHSVRSIAWGKRFIATGGTGDAVSIISALEPYPVLHIVKATGFVGSLDWKPDSDILAIGSRTRMMMIVRVEPTENGKKAAAQALHTVNYNNWVNKAKFSPGGTCLAVGVATGELFVYNVWEKPGEDVELTEIEKFKMADSVLDVSWSPDGKWLYAGGEDFYVTVIDTMYWQIVHRINRERWVQCISSSYGGTHVAVGGVNSEVSILDVNNGWDSVMGIELKGLVPLSAQWHPKDQAIALTGQSDSIIVVETTNARHVRGHHLRAASPILAIEFSPDGRLVLIGNEGGVVTLFTLSKSSFEISYELAVTFNDRLSMCWSRNGIYAVVGSKDALLILGRRPHYDSQPESSRRSNPLGSGSFSIQKVVRSIGATNAVSIDHSSRFIAVGGDRTIIFDSTMDFRPVREWKSGMVTDLQWSPDRTFLATMGKKNTLAIYDTSDSRPTNWGLIFSLKCEFPGCALSWSPCNAGGLQYLAYGGKSNHIYIMEIRAAEHTWETVLRIPREEHVYDLDWSLSGLLAAGSHNGTVAIVDLAYLQCGIPVHEKDYKWQRQALTCFTEIRRNRGHNIFQAVRWIPSAPGSDSLLAVGGTDGEVEIIDLTERKNCRGYSRKKKKT